MAIYSMVVMFIIILSSIGIAKIINYKGLAGNKTFLAMTISSAAVSLLVPFAIGGFANIAGNNRTASVGEINTLGLMFFITALFMAVIFLLSILISYRVKDKKVGIQLQNIREEFWESLYRQETKPLENNKEEDVKAEPSAVSEVQEAADEIKEENNENEETNNIEETAEVCQEVTMDQIESPQEEPDLQNVDEIGKNILEKPVDSGQNIDKMGVEINQLEGEEENKESSVATHEILDQEVADEGLVNCDLLQDELGLLVDTEDHVEFQVDEDYFEMEEGYHEDEFQVSFEEVALCQATNDLGTDEIDEISDTSEINDENEVLAVLAPNEEADDALLTPHDPIDGQGDEVLNEPLEPNVYENAVDEEIVEEDSINIEKVEILQNDGLKIVNVGDNINENLSQQTLEVNVDEDLEFVEEVEDELLLGHKEELDELQTLNTKKDEVLEVNEQVMGEVELEAPEMVVSQEQPILDEAAEAEFSKEVDNAPETYENLLLHDIDNSVTDMNEEAAATCDLTIEASLPDYEANLQPENTAFVLENEYMNCDEAAEIEKLETAVQELGVEDTAEQNEDVELSDVRVQDADFYINEAFALKESGKYDEAIISYMYALDQKPDDNLVFWVILDICVLYKQLGQVEFAKEILNSYVTSFGSVMDAAVKQEIEKNLQ
ncbi:MAG: hypothetical protein N2645_15045 [Clostridia bacterium]|nr:hypothetical protein [Clostridia bacterium]